MGLKQMLEKSFELLRTGLRSVQRRVLSSSSPSDDLTASGPHELIGPWEVGWTLGFHSSLGQLTEVGRLVRKYKYHGRLDLANRLADQILALIEQHPDLKAIDGIVLVPPSAARLYDPVILISQVLTRRLGVPLLTGTLAKTRTTAHQKEMRTRAQKRANVAGAFAVQCDIRGKSLLVLDDLYDSGETLKEVTRVLKRAGARSVKVLTLTCTRCYGYTALAGTQKH